METAGWILSVAASVMLILCISRYFSGLAFDEHMERGKDRLDAGFSGEALNEFRRCVVIRPGEGIAYLMRGEAYFRCGQREDAMEDLERAMRLLPEGNHREEAAQKLASIKRGIEILRPLN
jgi:tetratricopeptide (TPR) repeat protein